MKFDAPASPADAGGGKGPPASANPAATSPALTIIVPSYNRSEALAATIDQLLVQHHTDYELLVVDQSDGADAEANRLHFSRLTDPRLRYHHIETKGLPNARNFGLSLAAAEIVLFTDDDVILLSPHFIDAHLRCYADPAVGGVTGRHVERSLRSNSRRTACHVGVGGRTIFNLLGTERQEIGSCKGSNMSFRMEAVRQVGGFDRRTQMLEDTDFSVRVAAAGWRLLFEPEAEVVHLSTPVGGVRRGRGLPTECRRFRSTAYFVGKHRGLLGRACFVVTFGLIALQRTVRFRSLGTVPALFQCIASGLAEARLPPDDRLLPAAPA